MEGEGKFTWSKNGPSSPEMYKGKYFNNKKHGIGILKWFDGRIYRGYWAQGKQEGYGIFINEGKEDYGYWENGRRVERYSKQEANSLYCAEFNKIRRYRVKDFSEIQKLMMK